MSIETFNMELAFNLYYSAVEEESLYTNGLYKNMIIKPCEFIIDKENKLGIFNNILMLNPGCNSNFIRYIKYLVEYGTNTPIWI